MGNVPMACITPGGPRRTPYDVKAESSTSAIENAFAALNSTSKAKAKFRNIAHAVGSMQLQAAAAAASDPPADADYAEEKPEGATEGKLGEDEYDTESDDYESSTSEEDEAAGPGMHHMGTKKRSFQGGHGHGQFHPGMHRGAGPAAGRPDYSRNTTSSEGRRMSSSMAISRGSVSGGYMAGRASMASSGGYNMPGRQVPGMGPPVFRR